MSKRINWRDKAIKDIAKKFEMNESDAQKWYDESYARALQLSKGRKGEINLRREVYASYFYNYANVFYLDKNNKIQMNAVFEKSANLEKTRALERMKGFLEDYGDIHVVQSIFSEYMSGRMTRQEFNAYIKAFKNYNSKYLTSGS